MLFLLEIKDMIEIKNKKHSNHSKLNNTLDEKGLGLKCNRTDI